MTEPAPVVETPPPAPEPTGPAPGEEAVDESGNKLGFPAKTPVAEMNDKQAAAYWRNQAKVQQKIADARKDYDQNKADADQWREFQKSQQTPSEKAIEEAKLAAKKEVAGDTAMSLLRGILQTRGKDETEAGVLLEYVSPDRFLTSAGMVDHQKVTAYADTIAPAGSQQNGGGGYGQGRYEQPNVSRAAAGKAEAERRYGARK